MKNLNAPIIEIHGTGIHNRGAELMAIAISEKIKSIYPNAKIVVPSTFGFPADIKRYGFYVVPELYVKNKRNIAFYLANLIFGKKINPQKIDLILDASGFAFSDQWGELYSDILLKKANQSYRKDKPLVLLPQALGPFKDEKVKYSVKGLFNRAKVVCARDDESYKYASHLISDLSKLKKLPDFTIQVSALADENIVLPHKYVAIVPNIRMTDKINNKNDYISFVRESVDCIKAQGIEPLFIIHDAKEDHKIVDMLGSEYDAIKVIKHNDPRVLKYILGKAEFVIASRFHALVSAMSQGVPCVGAGWSHKYPELFKDFNNIENLQTDLSDTKKLDEILEKLCNHEYRENKSREIILAKRELEIKLNKMWDIIFNEINLIRK